MILNDEGYIIYTIKKNIAWILWTISLALIVSIVQMYSRDITLNKVHRTNFELIYKLFNEHDNINRTNIQEELNTYVRKSGFAIFQAAVVSKNMCSENTIHYYNEPLLCKTFKNINDLKPYVKLSEIETSRITREKKHKSYLIRKFSNANEYLVAKKIFYSKDSEISNFIYFITNRYYQANGYTKILDKGQFLFLTIFLTSFIIWLLNRLKYKNYRKQYRVYKNKEQELQDKLYLLDTKYNDIKRKRFENEKMLIEAELNLENIQSQSEEEKKKLQKTIETLNDSKDKLEQLFKDDEDLLEAIERESIELKNTIHTQIKKLELYEQKQENELTYSKLEKIEQLWRHEPSWKDRKNIESLVALKDTHLPFTITQGFIAFDKLVLKLVKNHDPYVLESQTNLNTNINIIFNNELLPLKYRKDFHDIRKARNEWFHAGIYPEIKTINFLVEILEDVNAEVFI